ncbi:MAG: nickel pincer cofactor biosynthesis protein LarC [Promethearchaeota archaeon]
MNSEFLYINCDFAGISGDLFLSALSDLIGRDKMANFLIQVLHELYGMAPSKDFTLNFQSTRSQGITGTHFEFETSGGNANLNQHLDFSDEDLHQDPHSHEHSHEHYSVSKMKSDLDKTLDIGECSQSAHETAQKILSNIINAEAQVHCISPTEIHLHEIGSIDTILDIGGTIYGLSELGLFNEKTQLTLFAAPIAVGGGEIKCAHGIMPVPAPATEKILENADLKYKYGPADFELATPTGVAIIAGLKEMKYLIQIPKSSITGLFQIIKSGIGIGTHIIPNRPNMLKIIHAIKINTSKFLGEVVPISVLETNLDDVRGEILGQTIDILMKNGALDVSIISTITKKNRPGYILKVVCSIKDVEKISGLIIKETGSLGVRWIDQRRIVVNRENSLKEIELDGKKFQIHVKIARDSAGTIISQKIEFEDLRKIAQSLGLSIRSVETTLLSKF